MTIGGVMQETAYQEGAYAPGTQDYGTDPNAESYSYPAQEPTEAPKPKAGINVPTVLASAGIAAVISALIVTIGVVGLMVADRDRTAAAAATPTVMNLGAAQNVPNQQQATPGAAAQPNAPAAAAPGTQAPAAEQVPESGGGGDSGPVQTQPQAQPQAAPQQNTGATTQNAAPAAAAPAALTPGQLNTKVNLVMNPGASRAARADELVSGERALRQIDLVAQAKASYGNVGFSYTVVNPVQVNGTTMTAPLKMSIVGRGSKTMQLTWNWTGSKWKLSDKSVCDVAGLVLLPCSL
ncbi:hypothetical protein ACWDTD_15985 [Gordonia sp. NPDC003425]